MFRQVRWIMVITVVVCIGGMIQAQRPDAPEYAQTGPYAIGTRELTLEDDARPLDVTLWYPAEIAENNEPGTTYPLVLFTTVAGDAVRDAAPLVAEAPYPLIIFSHGSGSSRVLSLWLTEHLASQGYVVIAANHPGDDVVTSTVGGSDFPLNYAQRPLDVLRLLDFAAELNAEGDFAGLIDVENTGVIGHSFGGYTALSAGGATLNTDQMRDICEASDGDDGAFGTVCFLVPTIDEIAENRGLDAAPSGNWPATTDPRIKAVVGLAPWNGPILSFDDYANPTLIIVGSADGVTIPERDAFSMYERITDAPAYLATLQLADHVVFIDDCPPAMLTIGAFDLCSDDVWDMARVHDISNHLTTAFFHAYLRGDDAAAAALAPDAIAFRGLTYEVKP